MNFEIIFIAGPQGSGKGTQGKKLADKLGFLFFGMGAILREIRSEDIQLAQQVASQDQGTLLPDEIIIDILKQRLASIPTSRGIVFDGVPRRLGQAEFLVPFLRGRGYGAMATVFIDLPREDSIKRLALRAENEQRLDDTTDAIERRFEYYDEMMPAVITYMKQETKFFNIDGRPSSGEVEQAVNVALGLV